VLRAGADGATYAPNRIVRANKLMPGQIRITTPDGGRTSG
jgi:hypothetical protein